MGSITVFSFPILNDGLRLLKVVAWAGCLTVASFSDSPSRLSWIDLNTLSPIAIDTLICDQSRVQILQLMSIRVEQIMAVILKPRNEFLKIVEISQLSALAKFFVLITYPVLSFC